MSLVLFFAAWVSAQVTQLGDDRFAVREAANARLDSVLTALFLPRSSEDPEIRGRLHWLRTKNRKWLDAVYVERRVFRANFEGWVWWYLVPNRSRIAGDEDTFTDIHRDRVRADIVFRAWPALGGAQGFLRGSILPGEYEQWLDFLDYHQGRAPPPTPRFP